MTFFFPYDHDGNFIYPASDLIGYDAPMAIVSRHPIPNDARFQVPDMVASISGKCPPEVLQLSRVTDHEDIIAVGQVNFVGLDPVRLDLQASASHIEWEHQTAAPEEVEFLWSKVEMLNPAAAELVTFAVRPDDFEEGAAVDENKVLNLSRTHFEWAGAAVVAFEKWGDAAFGTRDDVTTAPYGEYGDRRGFLATEALHKAINEFARCPEFLVSGSLDDIHITDRDTGAPILSVMVSSGRLTIHGNAQWPWRDKYNDRNVHDIGIGEEAFSDLMIYRNEALVTTSKEQLATRLWRQNEYKEFVLTRLPDLLTRLPDLLTRLPDLLSQADQDHGPSVAAQLARNELARAVGYLSEACPKEDRKRLSFWTPRQARALYDNRSPAILQRLVGALSKIALRPGSTVAADKSDEIKPPDDAPSM